MLARVARLPPEHFLLLIIDSSPPKIAYLLCLANRELDCEIGSVAEIALKDDQVLDAIDLCLLLLVHLDVLHEWHITFLD